MNINDGVGSTHLEHVRAAVLEHGADLGIAHDGDADRCLAVDAAGEIVDDDRIAWRSSLSMQERGTLTDDTSSSPSCRTSGSVVRWPERGIRVIETKVGDRYVLEALARAASRSAASSRATSS